MEQLVARALAGEREAWAGIWDLHGPRLHAYARRLLNDPYDADDVVADTFVSAAEHLGELRDAEALRPWLYAICRRHVQRRWQTRERFRPVEQDTLVRVADSQEHVVSASGLDAAEATELLWAAAEGLGPADRELLALVLQSDLDSGDVAAITGETPSAVYVRVSRLKDSLGRAAGALLVARHHREDCEALDALLAEWDGAYSALWRKRIARHVDGCEVCGGSRTAAAGALFGVAGLAPVLLLPELKRRCLDGVGSPELVPVSFETGWPVPQPWGERQRRRPGIPVLAPALGAALLALLLAVLALRPGAPAGAPDAAATGAPATRPATTAAAAPTAGPARSGEPRSGTPRPASSVPVAAPEPTPSTSATPSPTRSPVPAAPTVALSLSETALSTSCGSPTTTVATVTAGGSGARTVLSWDGTAPGQRAFDGSGEVAIGPFESVAGPGTTDTVTVRATVTDALGRSVTAVRTFTVSLAPC